MPAPKGYPDQLDLQALGFKRAVAAPTGRPAYHPADLLKLYIYGYLNRVRSSRLLERETQRNVAVMWLLKKLRPDFKTIADFRKDNLQAIKAVCREFTLLCKELGLFGGELVAIDGSKFKAVNSRARNFTQQKLARALERIEAKIETYLADLNQQDQQEVADSPSAAADLQTKIAQLQARQAQYVALQEQLEQSGETQLSLTDPDSRSMPLRTGTDVCYNVQTAVDAKHKLIVEHAVTNDVTDQAQLAPMAQRAKDTLGVESLAAVSDQGYYDGPQVKACLEQGITPYVPKPQTSANKKQGLFTKADFHYDRTRDSYWCPGGAELTYRFQTLEHRRDVKYYATPACSTCPIKPQCTRNKEGRRITRWVDEDLLDTMAERVRDNPHLMQQRKELVEHPFGTIKRAMDQGYFLLRGLAKVGAELSLTTLAYNMRRVITILGVPAMIAAVVASGTSALNAKMAVAWILVSMIVIIWWWIRATGREFSHGLVTGSAGRLNDIYQLR